jgi:hypothetical protein
MLHHVLCSQRSVQQAIFTLTYLARLIAKRRKGLA